MKNINYNLTKMLLAKLDNVWRLEKFYVKDAKKAKCKSAKALEQMLKDEKKHIEMLKNEISRKVKQNKFD